MWEFGISDPIVQCTIAVFVVSILFLAFPRIDVWFTGLFYDSSTGFSMDRLQAFIALRAAGNYAVTSVVVLLLVLLVTSFVRPRPFAASHSRKATYLLAALAMGPGLVVNLLFKEYWGRPRPDEIFEFGGATPYVSVWQISQFCATNCSFVSGEASAALWLVASATILPAAWRTKGLIALGIFAALLSLNRIAFGRHFLSDVLMAWTLTALVLTVLHRLMLGRGAGSS